MERPPLTATDLASDPQGQSFTIQAKAAYVLAITVTEDRASILCELSVLMEWRNPDVSRSRGK